MKLGENLQKLRKKYGFSQEELSEKCNVSRQAITKWESGDSTPTIDKLICLADLYNLPLDELVGRIPIDEDARFKEYLMKHRANDIPMDENDDISAIVVRYLRYVEEMGLDANQRLNGLQEIFLK